MIAALLYPNPINRFQYIVNRNKISKHLSDEEIKTFFAATLAFRLNFQKKKKKKDFGLKSTTPNILLIQLTLEMKRERERRDMCSEIQTPVHIDEMREKEEREREKTKFKGEASCQGDRRSSESGR